MAPLSFALADDWLSMWVMSVEASSRMFCPEAASATALPTSLLVYSTGKDDPATSSDETPQFKLAGQGSFYGAVYAPNATISLDGSGSSKGEMFGAVVGKSISFGGGYQFHYDEDLADLEDENAKKVTRWVELTDAAERKNMATILNDGL